jgi:hypothetical protein
MNANSDRYNFWLSHHRDQVQSGMTVSEFCRSRGLKSDTYRQAMSRYGFSTVQQRHDKTQEQIKEPQRKLPGEHQYLCTLAFRRRIHFLSSYLPPDQNNQFESKQFDYLCQEEDSKFLLSLLNSNYPFLSTSIYI